MTLEFLKENQSIILAAKISKAKNNTNYANITVGNEEGTSKVTIWGVGVPNPYIVGRLILMPKVQEKDGLVQTKSSDCIVSDCPESSPLRKLLPIVCSYESWCMLRDRLVTKLQDYPKLQVDFVSSSFDKLYQGYVKYPAASSNHHAYPGGLLQHTYEVLLILYSLINAVPYKFNLFIAIIGCLYHDFYKMMEYSVDGQYQPNMFLIGHSSGGAMVLEKLMRANGFDDKLILHCTSAVLSHHGRLEWGAPILPANIESFIVAKCDEISGHGVMYAYAETGDKVNGTTIQKYE